VTRAEVIAGLKCHSQPAPGAGCTFDCPFYSGEGLTACFRRIATAARALLDTPADDLTPWIWAAISSCNLANYRNRREWAEDVIDNARALRDAAQKESK